MYAPIMCRTEISDIAREVGILKSPQQDASIGMKEGRLLDFSIQCSPAATDRVHSICYSNSRCDNPLSQVYLNACIRIQTQYPIQS